MRLVGRPTLQTAALLVLVFLLQQVVAPIGALEAVLFVLDGRVGQRPWAIATSVYAHADLSHLLGNLLALALVGPLVAHRTTVGRFHAFFLATGALAGLAEVLVGDLFGSPRAVLGASGAILAFLGYLLAGNAVSTHVLDRLGLPPRVQLVVFAVVVAALTVVTSGPRSAVLGHAVGVATGLAAGRFHLLERRSPRSYSHD